MTEALYLDDPDRREFEAIVDRVLDSRVVLDRTAFYPEGGGQPADTGILRTKESRMAITDVQKTDTIYHHLDTEPESLSQGDTVIGELDWERRRGHMRHHTAQHLLSALLLDEFDAQTTGNQVYADHARLDCAYDRFDEDDLADIQDRLNDYIGEEHAVDWYELDRETAEDRLDTERTRIDLLPDSITEVRIVEIEDLDKTACAGTHVSSTGELGRAEVTGRETKGSDEERLTFELHDE